MQACIRMCACACVCAHSPQSTPPTHLHGLLQVLGGCSEAVGDEVLYNCVDPLTSRGHHTKSPPLHLPDLNTQCKQSEVVDSGKDCVVFHGVIHTQDMHAHISVRKGRFAFVL